MTKLKWHPSLKKTFKGCEIWWQSGMVKENRREAMSALLSKSLSEKGRFKLHPSALIVLAQTYSTEACLLGSKNEADALAHPLRNGVQFRALDFMKVATRSLPGDDSQPLLPFKSILMAVGPTMLSDWTFGRLEENTKTRVRVEFSFSKLSIRFWPELDINIASGFQDHRHHTIFTTQPLPQATWPQAPPPRRRMRR